VSRCRGLLATAVLCGVLAAETGAADTGDAVAAYVGAEKITVAEVDARCGAPCTRLGDEIAAEKWTALEALIDAALLADSPAPVEPPPSDTDVDAYMAERPQDFRGPVERDRAAVRFFLARERRRARDRERAARERRQRPPEMLVARDDPALGAPRPERVLARVGSRAVTDGDVETRRALPLYRLRGARHRERLRTLEAIVDDAVWRAAAADVGAPPANLRETVIAGAPPVTDADIDRYFDEEIRTRDPAATKRPDRLRPYLEFQRAHAAEAAFLADARARFGARVVLDEPPPPRLRLDAGPGGWRGAAGAPVRVVFLTSYRGETSRTMWRVVREVAAERRVALAVRPLLPQWDPEAAAVASGVYCAGAYGRAWELHDLAAGSPSLPDGAALAGMAATVGLDAARFAECMARPETNDAVAALSAAAEDLGLTEPPAVLIDGLVFGGMQGADRLRDAIRAAADRRR